MPRRRSYRRMRGGNTQQLEVGGNNAPMTLGGDVDGTQSTNPMFGGSPLAGVPIAGGATSGQQFGANAVIQRGGDGYTSPPPPGGTPPAVKLPAYMRKNLNTADPKIYGGNMGRVIVPAALVLANNMMGRGRSLRYKGKGAFRGKSSRYSRARYSRRRASRRSRR